MARLSRQAYALEAWLRLALGDGVQRHRLLAVLVAFHAWRGDFLIVLERLRKNPDASGEATFEYGNALMSVALDGDDQQEVMGGLETARILFTEAGRMDPNRGPLPTPAV